MELSDIWQRDERREELLLIERDIQIARQIQLGFLPQSLPQPAGWELAARFHPAREVAGDFYDAFMLTQNRRLGFVIADVCDKGVGAALFMALSRSLLHAFAQQHYNTSSWMGAPGSFGAEHREGAGRQPMPIIGANALKNAVALTNSYITSNHLDLNMFFTLFFGVLDPVTGTLIYVNGGHSPPAIVGAGGVKARLRPTGPAVGVFPDAQFELAQAVLQPGDTLFCYTDGVTDARSPEGQFFGEGRTLELLAASPASPSGLLDLLEVRLRAHIAGAHQFDDITMLTVGRPATSDQG